MINLKTERLHIRQLQERDLDRIWEMSQMPNIIDNLEWKSPKKREEINSYVDAEKELWKKGEGYHFVILLNEFCIGRVFMPKINNEWRIGYFIDPKYWGKGYASEAVKKVMDYAFNSLGIHELSATVHPENKPSIKILERLGMTKIDDVKIKFTKNNEDLDLYSKKFPS